MSFNSLVIISNTNQWSDRIRELPTHSYPATGIRPQRTGQRDPTTGIRDYRNPVTGIRPQGSGQLR